MVVRIIVITTSVFVFYIKKCFKKLYKRGKIIIFVPKYVTILRLACLNGFENSSYVAWNVVLIMALIGSKD